MCVRIYVCVCVCVRVCVSRYILHIHTYVCVYIYIYIYIYIYTYTHTLTQNGILLSHKKTHNFPFAATWMDLEAIMTNEISQRKTNTV